MTNRRPRATAGVEREDLLMVSISLVKGRRRHAAPADFVSDVVLTFQTLGGRTRQDGYPETFPAIAASTVSGSGSWQGIGPQPDRVSDWPVAS